VQTSLGFLLQNKNLPDDKIAQLQSLSTQVQSLQAKLQEANDIQTFVREREATLKEQLINTGLGKQLTGINKQVYYYQAQLAEYKAQLNDKEKLKEKLLITIRTLPAFQTFWQKYSYLAALFPVPANYGTPQALAGLQTRSSIQNLIAQRVGTGGGAGVNPQQYFQGQVDAAQAQLSQLKNKLNQLGTNSGSSDMTMPEFKPNAEKTKSFLQRLEYGFNIQSAPSSYIVPTTTDFALTLGYKLSDTKKFGIGASYKMGWGTSLQDIQISSQGIGLRSYGDIKAKGSIWLSGGFEYNYLSAFRNIRDLQNNIAIWQRSALLGLSKKYKIGKKKEGNMQLLYDFLHNQQIPPSQALKFRIGYTF
jgi:prefoldin subunit 5